MIKTKRRLIKFSNYSFCITLPKEALESFGWGKGDWVEVSFARKKQKITIEKAEESAGNKKTSAKSNAKSAPKSEDYKPIPPLRW